MSGVRSNPQQEVTQQKVNSARSELSRKYSNSTLTLRLRELLRRLILHHFGGNHGDGDDAGQCPPYRFHGDSSNKLQCGPQASVPPCLPPFRSPRSPEGHSHLTADHGCSRKHGSLSEADTRERSTLCLCLSLSLSLSLGLSVWSGGAQGDSEGKASWELSSVYGPPGIPVEEKQFSVGTEGGGGSGIERERSRNRERQTERERERQRERNRKDG